MVAFLAITLTHIYMVAFLAITLTHIYMVAFLAWYRHFHKKW
jgi:hypothetical protein